MSLYLMERWGRLLILYPLSYKKRPHLSPAQHVIFKDLLDREKIKDVRRGVDDLHVKSAHVTDLCVSVSVR